MKNKIIFQSATQIAKDSKEFKTAKAVNDKLLKLGLIERNGKKIVPTEKAKKISNLFIQEGKFKTLKWNFNALEIKKSEKKLNLKISEKGKKPIAQPKIVDTDSPSYFNIDRDHWEKSYYQTLGKLEEILNSNPTKENQIALKKHIDSKPKFYRTSSGFKTRSKGEFILATHLEKLNIPFKYEYRADCLENIISDFYLEFMSIKDGSLHTEKIYIELWGLENQPEYKKRKQEKINLYKKNGLTLVEFSDNVLSHDIDSIFELEFIRRFGKNLKTMRNEHWKILMNM